MCTIERDMDQIARNATAGTQSGRSCGSPSASSTAITPPTQHTPSSRRSV